MREVRLSGPAALPGFSLDSCFATPFTDIVISGIARKLKDFGSESSIRCLSFRGISLVKTDWN